MNKSLWEDTKESSDTKKNDFFEQMFHQNYGALLAYAQKYVFDKQTAEDIVQDVFMAVWIKRKEIDFTESMSSYLYKSVYHKSLNYLKKQANLPLVDVSIVDLLIHQEMHSYDLMDMILFKEMSTGIVICTDKLPPKCKDIFILSRGKNLKNKEIAEILGVTEKTIEKQISKALRLLREHLKKTGFLMILFLFL